MMNDPFQLPSSSFYRQEYRGIHPLSSSPSSATINTYTTTNSNNITTSMNSPPTNIGAGLFFEQVTTIFVVGFPEDMHEREFQNMFMFSPGFMGASLKWNCKDQDDDSATFSASTTNFSMTIPGATCVMTSPASMNGKKQMIGFAKFRSRLEALEAVDVISGKKIDQGSDITLKAEIAKKNLHIKHGSTAPIANATPMDTTASSSSTSSSSSSSSVSSSSLTTSNDPSNRNNNTSTGSTSGIDKTKNMMLGYHDFFTFSPLPSDLLSPMVDYNTDPFESTTTADHHPHHLQQSHSMTPTTPVFNDNLFAFRSYSIDGRNSNSRVFGRDGMDSNSNSNALGIAPRSSISSTTSLTQQMSIKQPQNNHFSVPDDPSLDPFYYLSKSSPAPVDRFDAYGLNGPTTTGPMGMNGFGTTATVGKATPPLRSNPAYPQRSNSVMMQPTSTNLADQNPPCNTLYVGNLPSNTIEDELRQLFSKCTGYKRMYFRTKPQGPMCFVEFDDVIYATQTMSDLQGQALSNSLKGGIRLSFSKNPLFIKPQHRSTSRPFDPPL